MCGISWNQVGPDDWASAGCLEDLAYVTPYVLYVFFILSTLGWIISLEECDIIPVTPEACVDLAGGDGGIAELLWAMSESNTVFKSWLLCFLSFYLLSSKQNILLFILLYNYTYNYIL